MKKRDIEALAKRHGWEFKEHAGSHDHWAKPGHRDIAIPRHTEVREGTSKALCKRIRATSYS